MLGKNNYNERLRKMEMQDKQDHFSIRKLSIGAASVLLGFTFFGLNSQSVKADTIDPSQNVTEESNRDKSNTETKETGTKDKTKSEAAASKKKNETDLSTFSGLSSFLKSSKTDEVKDTSSKDKTDTTAKDKTDKEKQETSDSTGNSTTTPATGSDEGKQDTTTDKTPTDITGSDDQNSDTSKLPTDVTGDTNSDKDKSEAVADNDNNNAITKRDTTDMPEVINHTVQVTNWDQFLWALQDFDYYHASTPNEKDKITEIDVMNNIAPKKTGKEDHTRFNGRTLLIKSGGTGRHIIDFKGIDPHVTSKGTGQNNSQEQLNLTFENLTLYSVNYWGVIHTNDNDDNPHITFKDIEYYGTQMVHSGDNTTVTFQGKNIAQTIEMPYVSPVDGQDDIPHNDNRQQLFEFTGKGNTIIFDENTTFDGATFGGNVIQMNGQNCQVNIKRGANVTLAPAGTANDALTNTNNAETSYSINGIYLGGTDSSVNVDGILNINVEPSSKLSESDRRKLKKVYAGKLDSRQAKAITLSNSNSHFKVGNNGQINVKTNGDISTHGNKNSLIDDSGDFTISPGGSLNVTANDMGNYSGTLVYINGKADVENGTFNIRITNDKTVGAGTGAGTGKITLVDAPGNLIVNNPYSLVLDCHLNHTGGTSIIGQNKITITNVRQILTPDETKPEKRLTLPPFHVLQVVNTSSSSVNMDVPYLELLNGKRKFNQDKLDFLYDKKNNPYYNEVQKILENYHEVKDMLPQLAKGPDGKGTSYDDIFKAVISFAFSKSTNPGYNNIAFGPANPSGFLDIDPNTVHVTYNSDGSSTISGHVLNYTEVKDGESSDGIFGLLLPGGTKAYVQAIITDPKGNKTIWTPNPTIDNPYADTNDNYKGDGKNHLKDLEDTFSAVVEKNGTFEFTIPTDETNGLTKGYKIALYPDANFVQYNPLANKLDSKDPDYRPIIKDVLVAAQDTAAQEIQNKLTEIQNEQLTLTDDERVELNNAIATGQAAIAKGQNNNGSSVYDSDVNDIKTVNDRKNKALKALNEAYETAKAASDKANAIKDTQTIAKTNISKAAQDAIIRVKLSGLSEDKQNEYIKNIDDAENAALENPATSDSSIYYPGKTKAQIEDLQQKATDKINKAAAKAEVAGYTEKGENTLGIPSPDSDIDSALNKELDNIDHATDIDVAENTAKENMLGELKKAAKKQLDQAEKDVESKLEKVKGLTADDIEKAKQAAKDLLANSNKTGYEDQIDNPETNTIEDVNTAAKDGIDALNKLLTDKSSLGNKNDAINAINQARDNAINEINDKAKYPNLTDEDRNSLINTIKADATEGVDNVNKDTDPAKITADKQAAIDKINSVKVVASSKDLAGLNKEKSSQLKALQDAATNAKDAIDKLPDSNLSPSDKQYYKDLIDKHAASATNAINSASSKDDIDTAEKDGESNINGDLVSAQVAAAKSQAIEELNKEKSDDKKVINNAHKDGTLGDDDWEKALDAIDNAYTTAITAVSNDHTPADVVTDKNIGINAMKTVADTISQDKDKAKLAADKNNAIADLEDQAQALHDHIQADPNLSNTEKNNYFDQISSTLNNAKQAVSAADKNTVNSAHNAGIEDLNDIRNNADLQSARDKALTDLQHEFNTDNAAIDGLGNISTAGKAGIKTDLQNAYNEAVNKVKDPTSNTVAKINSQSDAGITNMENILGKAKGLDKTISDDKQKLNDYAQKAIDRINSSTMLDADKGAATTNIQKARDDAEALVGKQLTVEDANKAEKDGETSILQAEAKANKDDMDKAKDAAKAKIDGAQKTALQNLNDAYDALTDDEKKQAQAAYDKAVKDIPALAKQAKSAIDKAFDKDTISGLTNDAINSINTAGDTANVAMTKVVAVQAVKDAAQAAKDKLTNKRDKDGVDDVAKLGIADINAATTSSTVLQIKDNALNSIKNIKDSGTGDASADDALWAKKDKANAELAQELADIDSAIDKLTDLTSDQKKQFKDQAQAAHDRAHIVIEGAAESDIETDKGIGKTNIDKALSDAKLQVAKNVAKADVDKTADDAIDQVNKDNTISKDDKDKIIININKDRDNTKDKIDNAKTPEEIKNDQQKGKDHIKGEIDNHGDNGTDTDQTAKDKKAAKENIQTAADKINDRIDKDEKDGKLDHDQAKALKDKVSGAVDAANDAISQAGDSDAVGTAENDGNNALSEIISDINKTEAVNNALDQITDAVDRANDAADKVAKEVGKTEKEQQKLAKQMKDAIEKQRAAAAKNIKDAQNAADDPLNAIKTAGQKGVDAITGLTNDYTAKVDQIKTLKQKADAAKDDLSNLKTDENGNPVLTASDVAQGEADIDDAVQTGISDIYQASSVDDAKTAEQKAEDAVGLAKLPTELLAEKNKQIAAINQYATAADKTIDGFAQSDQNKDGLPADTITALKKQVEAAKNKAISKINDVTIAKGASQAKFDEAKTNVQNAEKGVAENNETVDFGEAGIDKVKTLAKQKADVVKAKNDKIAELEQKQEEANKTIENSGMSPADQKPLKDQVQKLVDKAKDQIINISDTDDKGNIKTPKQVKDEADTIINNTVNGFEDQDNSDNKVQGINNIVDNAKLKGAQTTAEKTLNNKRAQAHDIINGSQLTADQKQKANKAIDDAFNTEKSAIDAKTNINDVPKDEDQIGQAIDAIWTKPTSSDEKNEWFNDEENNALSGTDGVAGLQAGLDELKDKHNPDDSDYLDYKGYLDDINNAITAINNAKNIKDASSAYDKGMTSLNKLNALDQVKDDANKAKTNIDNSDLNKGKERLEGDIDKIVEDTKDKLNQIDSSVGNASTNKDKIDQITHDAQSDIATIENDFGIEDQSNDVVNANNEISKNHSDAIDTIHNEFGDDSKTPKTDDAYEKNKHVHSTTDEGINSDKTNADKEISKGAIDDAADIAKDKVNHLKHEDGTDYTDADKNKINEQIDKDATDAKNKIDKADNITDIDNIRDNGIHQIHQDCSDPSTIDNILHGNSNNGNNGGGGVVAPIQPATPAKNPTTNTSDKDKPNGTNVDLSNASDVTLMHNAYLYDETGKRANKITLGAGSVLTTYGTKTINGKDYYVLVDKGANNKKYYVAVGNVVAATRKLKHNAYIYNQFGKRVKNTGVFKKGKLIKTFGNAVKIRGKKYFIIDKNRFVKAANFAKGVVTVSTAKVEVVPTSAVAEKPKTIVEKTLMHNAYLYDQNGTRANKLIFQAGSKVGTVGKKTVNGKVCYELPDGMFIAAGNIDAKKLKLKHNAYVYNQYGHRANKKVLKKRKSVKTYGNSVKINGKRYFIISKGRFVKKANF